MKISKLVRKTKISDKLKRYDIAVQDTSCFFANDILVHNSAWRMGIDENGNFFGETSNSGPIIGARGFTKQSIAKYGDVPEWIPKFDNLKDDFENFKPLRTYLKNNFPNGVKLIGEIFYIPLGEIKKDKIKFVGIDYETNKIGSKATFIVYNVLNKDGGDVSNKPEVIEDLKKLSTKEFKFDDPKININDVDINFDISDMMKSIQKYGSDIKTLLVSRKKADKEQKLILRGIIEKFQQSIATKIIKSIEHGKYSQDFEGIVIKLTNGDMLKITSDKFKAHMASKK